MLAATILHSLSAVCVLLIVIGFGVFLARKGWFDAPSHRGIVSKLVNAALPCFLFYSVISKFSHGELYNLLKFAGLPFLTVGLNFLISILFIKLGWVRPHMKGTFIAAFTGATVLFVGVLPYLYEINLRRFLSRLQYYVNTDQLIVRLWKDDDNSYHLKGMWVDDEWMLLTGNNLNPRAWRLDLENAILIHDPKRQLGAMREKELKLIRTHTTVVKHYRDLQSIADYPVKVRKLIRRLRRIRIDRLISRIL